MLIAYIGPWNYHSGLGEASRGILSALLNLGEGFDLHYFGLEGAFGPHMNNCNSNMHAAGDYSIKPDICILQLNPDAWSSSLSNEQITLLNQSKYRVGLCLWESLQVPFGWSLALNSLDEIWTPSQFCKKIFSTITDVPIAVIPLVVVKPPSMSSSLTKNILYCFDSASFIIRKNPIALVEAFVLSGLASSGWNLTLKTKNLDDSCSSEKERTQLLSRISSINAIMPGSISLINCSINKFSLLKLIQNCYIYASPHCSEGFGLTIAEAMLSGRLVVSTNFSGPTDFLSPENGFPVSYDLVKISDGMGAYPTGSSWANISIPHLCASLLSAASLREHEAAAIKTAAVNKIIEYCSIDSVSFRIKNQIKHKTF